MKTNLRAGSPIAATLLFVALVCSGQSVRISGFDASGRLGFTLSPTGLVTNYACSVEWCPALTHGGWTNAWHQPFTPFAQSNGNFFASLPGFFRVGCVAGAGQATNTPGWTNYVVTGVVPAQIADGLISWANNGDTGLFYSVESATSSTSDWSGRWAYQTNIHATATVTNFVGLPMLFRVVTITPNNGVENPW